MLVSHTNKVTQMIQKTMKHFNNISIWNLTKHDRDNYQLHYTSMFSKIKDLTQLLNNYVCVVLYSINTSVLKYYVFIKLLAMATKNR